ncbi:MAG: universal stress protein [Chloroflexi bacterium]|nr:universal stress protein [Chloroflexota bacterium]
MKILVPVDKSHRDGIVLPYITQTAKAFRATVIVTHIVPLHRAVVPGAVREAEAYASAVAAGLREQEVDAESVVRRGDPAPAIVALAGECQVDMIVMTSRGRSGIGKLVLGSVADAVLANCQKPVILLSESVTSERTDDTIRQQSAYLAAVVWNKQSKGLYTAEDAKRLLERLATSGLDRGVLFSSYKGLEEDGGIPFGWLDINFQMRALLTFLPEEIEGLEQDQEAPLSPSAHGEWFPNKQKAA